MSRQVVSWGKQFLFFSMALLLGLFLTQRMLVAHSYEEPVKAIDLVATESVQDLSTDEVVNGEIYERIRRSDEERRLLSLQAPEVRLHLREVSEKGDPLALLAVKKLYGVDGKGRVNAVTGQAAAHLPVLTGAGLKYNAEKLRVDGALFREAVVFIKALQDCDDVLSQQLSEINCHPELGLIAYFSHTGALPVFIGVGDLPQKIKNLHLFFEQLGTTNLMGQLRYLDARFADQIVVKKLKSE